MVVSLPNKHDTLNQCRLNVVPQSAVMLAEHAVNQYQIFKYRTKTSEYCTFRTQMVSWYEQSCMARIQYTRNYTIINLMLRLSIKTHLVLSPSPPL